VDGRWVVERTIVRGLGVIYFSTSYRPLIFNSSLRGLFSACSSIYPSAFGFFCCNASHFGLPARGLLFRPLFRPPIKLQSFTRRPIFRNPCGRKLNVEPETMTHRDLQSSMEGFLISSRLSTWSWDNFPSSF
jgi:hypothetical protein